MIENGEIITLDDGKEYIVLNKKCLHTKTYVYLMSNFKPVEILVLVEKFVNGEYILEEITDNNELDYILSLISTNDINNQNLYKL